MNRIHLAAALLLAWIGAGAQNHPSQRPAEKDRLFRSDAVEAKLKTIKLEVTTAQEATAAAVPEGAAEKAGVATA